MYYRSLSQLYMGSVSPRRVPLLPGTLSSENNALRRTVSDPIEAYRLFDSASDESPVTQDLGPHDDPDRSSINLGSGLDPVRIGLPDYSGWIRKKSDRQNSWEFRYLTLSGPYLHYFRNRTVCL
jgi:hypothetical protein